MIDTSHVDGYEEQLEEVGQISNSSIEEDIRDLKIKERSGGGHQEVDVESYINQFASKSKRNEGEGRIVNRLVREMIEVNGIKPSDIAVISPYNAQVKLIKSFLSSDFPKLEIRSVDGFQGGEKEVVIMSFVRRFFSFIKLDF